MTTKIRSMSRRLANRASQHVYLILGGVATFLYGPSAMAIIDVDRGYGDGMMGKAVALFQDYVNFVEGPFAMTIIIAAIVGAVLMWMFAPKTPIMQTAVRIVSGGILLFNIPALLGALS